MACTSTPPKELTPTSTPTPVIFGKEVTPTLPPSIPANATPGTSTPDNFTIQGTYDEVVDVTVTDRGGFVSDKNHMTAQFTLKSVPGNLLTGTAQLTYTEGYKMGGKGCKIAWSAGPLAWNPVLEGTYAKQSDGSLQVFFKAMPVKSPAFTGHSLCLEDLETASWPGAGGILVNGRYDKTRDYPSTGSGISGSTRVTYHMELVAQP